MAAAGGYLLFSEGGKGSVREEQTEPLPPIPADGATHPRTTSMRADPCPARSAWSARPTRTSSDRPLPPKRRPTLTPFLQPTSGLLTSSSWRSLRVMVSGCCAFEPLQWVLWFSTEGSVGWMGREKSPYSRHVGPWLNSMPGWDHGPANGGAGLLSR